MLAQSETQAPLPGVARTSASSFRDLCIALDLPSEAAVLDVGAGGFQGSVTTRHLMELFPTGVTAVERFADRAEDLRQIFGPSLHVVTANYPDAPVGQTFDLVVVDFDSTGIPAVFGQLLDGPIARNVRAGGYAILTVMSDYGMAYSGPYRFNPSGAPLLRAFLLERFGALRLSAQDVASTFSSNPLWEPLHLEPTRPGDEANSISWLALRRTDHPAAPEPEDNDDQEQRDDVSARLQDLVATNTFVALDCVGDTATCGAGCQPLLAYVTDWAHQSFDGTSTAGRIRELLGDPPELDGIADAAVIPGTPLALLLHPGDLSNYLALIGDKSRNMLRKFDRTGATFQPFTYNDHLDEIYDINTSKEVRSGRPMRDQYRQRPQPITQQDVGCARHRREHYGIFQGNTLVAYCRVYVLNQLAVISQIMGHADALPLGVMNGLVRGLTAMMLDDPNLQAINYLTLRSATVELDRFKKSVGFRPYPTALSVPPLADARAD